MENWRQPCLNGTFNVLPALVPIKQHWHRLQLQFFLTQQVFSNTPYCLTIEEYFGTNRLCDPGISHGYSLTRFARSSHIQHISKGIGHLSLPR